MSYLFKYSDVVSVIMISEINHSFGFISFYFLASSVRSQELGPLGEFGR